MTVKSRNRKVNLNELTYDPIVQRVEGVDMKRVAKMAENFNADALGILICSERANGVIAVLDGGHRVAAARMAGHTEPLDAKVFVGLTLAQEASLFLLYNDKKDPSSISSFRGRVVSEDPVAIAVNRIINYYGWTVASGHDKGCLAAVKAAEKVYRNGHGAVADGVHPELLDAVLDIITDAWEWYRSSVDSALLAGMGQLCGRFGKSINRDKMIRELQKTRPNVIIGRARVLKDAQGGTVPAAMAKILTGMHNSNKRTNLLPDWVWVR